MGSRDAINRVLTFLLGAALADAGAMALLVVTNAVNTGTLAYSDWFRDQYQRLDGLTGTDATVATIVSAAVLAIGVVIVLFELVPAGRRARELMVRDANGNSVSLSPDSVSLVAEQAAMEVTGVLNATMAVREEGDGVIVNGDVALLDDANVAEKTNEITARVKSALQDRMRVKVVRLAMKMRLASAAEAAKTQRGRDEAYPYRPEKTSSAH